MKRILLLTIILLSSTCILLAWLGWFDIIKKVTWECYKDLRYEVHEEYLNESQDGLWVIAEKQISEFVRRYHTDRSNQPVDGISIFRLADESLYWQGQVVSVTPWKPQGEVKYYFADGMVWRTIQYDNGLLHGSIHEFDNYGLEILSGSYFNGQPHGLFKYKMGERQEVYDSGRLILAGYTLADYEFSLERYRDIADDLFEAEYHWSSGDFNLAKTFVDQVLKQIPELKIALRLKGIIQYSMAEHELAYQTLEESLSNKLDEDFMTQYYLGYCAMERGMNYVSIAHFKEALTFYENYPELIAEQMSIYAAIAQLSMNNHDYDEALFMTKKLIANGAEDVETKYQYVYLLDKVAFNTSREDLEKEVNKLLYAVEGVKLGHLYSIKARIFQSKGDYGKAEVAVQNALDLDAGNATAQMIHSSLYPQVNLVSAASVQRSNLIAAAILGLMIWEFRVVRGLFAMGRYSSAARTIAGNVIVGKAVEYGYEELTKPTSKAQIQSLENSQVHHPDDLEQHALESISLRSNPRYYASTNAGNQMYQGITASGNHQYMLKSRYLHNTGVHAKYFRRTDPDLAYQAYSNYQDQKSKRTIEFVDYANGKWHYGIRRAKYFSQKYRVTDYFPGAKIKEYWSEGYALIDLAYGNGQWVAIYRENQQETNPFKAQFVQVFYAFPEEAIAQLWEAGYFIRRLKYCDGRWLLVMNKTKKHTTTNMEQRLVLNNIFPTDKLKELEQSNFHATSLTYGRGLFVLVANRHK